MAEVIAGLYELNERIGSGGAGIVYLGTHQRLRKKVVLKADKRKLTTKPEKLRREVDALKNLSHMYIPQVYDYVQENDTVYTVMDFIEGESLDKPLARGERFSQPQIIEWACELLEALVYLHSRPPHGILHSDIKPANIMVTPQKEIRLIDFNIALAMGEEGSVRVGYSRGYASPEHYGVDFRGSGSGGVSGTSVLADAFTQDGSRRSSASGSGGGGSSSGSSSTGGKRTVLLDVRSDIYSVGATLYHLLSGKKPASDPREVPRLDLPGVSPQIADIVAKAMSPDPNRRYQTAAEMLRALEHLHENDPRSRRRRTRIAATAAALILCFSLGGGFAFAGQRMLTAEEEQGRIAAEYAERQAREAELAAQKAQEEEERANRALELVNASRADYARGAPDTAAEKAAQALKLDTVYNPEAQYALTDALGVYDLSDSFVPELAWDLPSEPLKVGLSPEGSKAFAICAWEARVYSTVSGELLAALPVQNTARSDAVFLDENRIVYAGTEGVTCYDLQNGRTLWTGEPGTNLTLAPSGGRLAAIYKDSGEGQVYDTESGNVIARISFGEHRQEVKFSDAKSDPEREVFCLNSAGSYLAVSFSNGFLGVYEVDTGESQVGLPTDYTVMTGGFYGDYLAITGSKGQDGTTESMFWVTNIFHMEDELYGTSQSRLRIQADDTGVYLSGGNTVVRLDTATREQEEKAYSPAGDVNTFICRDGYTLISVKNGGFAFYDRGARLVSCGGVDTSESADYLAMAGGKALVGSAGVRSLRLLSLNSHTGSQVFAYDPSLIHREIRIHEQVQTALMFSNNKLWLFNLSGEQIAEVEPPDTGSIYDMQYRRNGDKSWMEVIYQSGRVIRYSVETLEVISDAWGVAPDANLEEDFFTDRYRIHKIINEAPIVYDIESGEQVAVLDRKDSITYVTQVGENLIVEYVASQTNRSSMTRYGVLMDSSLTPLAELPGLCDIVGETLYFDYPSGGVVRSCKLLSREVLLSLAEE